MVLILVAAAVLNSETDVKEKQLVNMLLILVAAAVLNGGTEVNE